LTFGPAFCLMNQNLMKENQTQRPRLTLDTDLQYIKGIGPKLAQLLKSRGLSQVQDFLDYFPRAYEDRRAIRNIKSLQIDDIVSIKAEIVKISSIALGKSHRRMYDIFIKDDSGAIHCKFFRVPFKGYFDKFQPGSVIKVTGKVTLYRNQKEFHHPDIKEFDQEEEISDVIVPIYTEIDNINSNKIYKIIKLILERIKEDQVDVETLPDKICQQQGLLKRQKAYEQIHQPEVLQSELLVNFRAPAQIRFIFEDFFWLQAYLASRKSEFESEKILALQSENKTEAQILNKLPFKLTSAQNKAIEEIKNDLMQTKAMNRLIQGDVGCGKTLVAWMSASFVIDNGYQACVMVPTEILAEQHFKNAIKTFENTTVKVGLMTGSLKKSEKEKIMNQLANQDLDLVIGTHALIEDPVVFKKLGLVVVDEQHRFGVEQRAALKKKSVLPHFLLMTATPIPRTLALTAYGDLNVTIIDELPPGRMPIQTRVTYQNKHQQIFQFVAEQIQKGRQAYVIYPLVAESEKIDLKNAMDEYEKLSHEFPNIKFGLVHGKLKAQEKNEVMEQFQKGTIQILVSTTVVEVGVDVPNANIIVVQHAERFGLSQLHQLRGRVGRGEHKSFCILVMGYAVSEESQARLAVMENHSDGFKIAEADLEIRGPGEFLGTKQSGLAGFNIANLARDGEILNQARNCAFEIFKQDPKLEKVENLFIKQKLLQRHGPTFLASIG